MRNLFFTLLTIAYCLFTACNETPSSEVQIIHIDPQRLSTKSFSEFYRIKEVIPLETNDSSPIPGIGNIIFSEHEIIVSDSWGGGSAFYIFDRKGNFIKKVDKTGNGPDEYGSRIGVFVVDQADPNNNLIMNKSPRLLYYNYHNWKLVKEAKWIGASAVLGALPNGDFLAYQEFGAEDGYFITVSNQ